MPLTFTQSGRLVWREYISDGVPASGLHPPDQAEIVLWSEELEARVANALAFIVLDRDLATPPASPTEGDRYIVAATPSGGWSAFDENDIVEFDGADWVREVPTAGRRAFLDDEGFTVEFNGTSWTQFPLADVGNPASNLLLNGNGRINQRLLTSIADDTYGHDAWYALTQTGAIAPSTVTAASDIAQRMFRLTQSQASAQRMGYAHIIEAADCEHLRNRDITLSGALRCSLSQAIRYAVLAWTGTADAVTSDVVNNWASGTYTPGNFFIGSNLTVLGTGSLTPTANTITELTSLTVDAGSSFTNLIVLIWSEGTLAQNATLDFALKLEEGSVATRRAWRPFAQALALCERRFEKSTSYSVAIQTANDAINSVAVLASSIANGDIYHSVRFRTTKRSTPSGVTTYPYTSPSTTGSSSQSGSGTDYAAGSASVIHQSSSGFNIFNNSGGSLSVSSTSVIVGWFASADL